MVTWSDENILVFVPHTLKWGTFGFENFAWSVWISTRPLTPNSTSSRSRSSPGFPIAVLIEVSRYPIKKDASAGLLPPRRDAGFKVATDVQTDCHLVLFAILGSLLIFATSAWMVARTPSHFFFSSGDIFWASALCCPSRMFGLWDEYWAAQSWSSKNIPWGEEEMRRSPCNHPSWCCEN